MSLELLLEEEIKKAILNKEINIAYQPIISTKDKKVISLESLFRLQNESLNKNIDKVIKIAKKHNLLNNVTDFMLDNIIEDFSKWSENKLLDRFFTISINISPCQLNKNFIKYLEEKIENKKISSKNIAIEITEMEEINIENIEVINELYEKKYKIALDDFGTGFSSLNNLIKLPYHVIKIDKDFIKNVEKEESMEKSLIEMIITLSKSSNFKVVCEGIETKNQAKILNKMKCDFQQGYLYSKPVYKDEIIHTIKNIHSFN